MAKRVTKRVDRVTVVLGGPPYAKEGAEISLVGGDDYRYLRVEIPASPPVPPSVVAWCDGRSMRAFVAEAARRLGLMDKAKGKRK